MAEESNEDKTESPTPHRLEKARQEGQIPRSRELTSVLMLLAGLLIIWLGGHNMAQRLASMVATDFRFDHGMVNDDKIIVSHIGNLVMQAVIALLPLMADVPKADVIVTNPTHYSVALQYEEGKMSAPK
ncbi:hypothetical protein E05_14410 [Plautia stali symbiont]|nr:hypothetical protein E05_14410 [Plautia stali symbiont]